MPQLSTMGRLGVLSRLIFLVLPLGLYNAIRAAGRALCQGYPLPAALWNGFARALMSRMTPSQLQAILPSTIDTYREWCASEGFPPVVDVLRDGVSRLLWLQKGSPKVVLFFHGGGYVMPLSRGHLDWMAFLQNEAAKTGVAISVGVLEYDLIPDNPYPRQMEQAIQALQKLIDIGYAPSDIIFGGDSAGGHLSLSLLAHLHHRRPDEPGFHGHIALPENAIRGCFLVSPLTSFDVTVPSYHRRFSIDVLCAKGVWEWGQLLVQKSPWHREIALGRGWGMALDVSEQWWDGLSAVERVLVTGGEQEVFRDHVVRLMEVLRRRSRANLEVVGYIAAKEAHDAPLMDFTAKREPQGSARLMIDWVIESFK